MKAVNLWDVEAVKAYIQDSKLSGSSKEIMEYAYADWSEFKGFKFKPHAYPRTIRLPFPASQIVVVDRIAGLPSQSRDFSYGLISTLTETLGLAAVSKASFDFSIGNS